MFNSVENYFQYQKACHLGDSNAADLIMSSDDPVQQMRIGRRLPEDKQLWNDTIAEQTMEIGIKAKFEQDPGLKTQILQTGSKLFINCNRYEKFWANGLGLNDKNAHMKNLWKGANKLGNILVSVRQNLK